MSTHSMVQSIILIGSPENQLRYISEFIEKHRFASYNIRKFSENIGIDHIRDVKKFVSFTDSLRMVIFEGKITEEAQNALLKTIEELSEKVHIFFCPGKQNPLLETVTSRSRTIRLGEKTTRQEKNSSLKNKEFLYGFVSARDPQKTISEVFLFAQDISTQGQIEELLMSGRALLHELAFQDDMFALKRLCILLCDLADSYSLVTTNNINKRFSVESVLLRYI